MTKNLFQKFTYENVQRDFEIMLTPFKKDSKAIRKGYCEIIDAGTKYTKEIAQIEMFMRLLWGASPYYKQNDYDSFFEDIVSGIKEGTNPKGPYYWQDLFSYSQMLVEVASLSIFLIEHEAIIKRLLNEKELRNISNWLDQMNKSEHHKNNWIFFRILSNMSMKLVFDIDRRQQIEKDFNDIEAMYLKDGWYMDGRETQKDYYISFAFHYYSLLYAKFFEKEDAERSTIIKKRAVQFAKSFQHMFDEHGRAIPFGRSLTYRFAQSSFFSMMVYSGIEEYPMNYSKYFLENNLKNWFQQEIMTPRYELSLGYYYHNMNMLEEYNAYGSPYWAFKTFRFLALPKEHAVYDIDAEYPKDNNKKYFDETMGMLIEHTETGVRTYPLAQRVYHHTNGKAKYEKYVYSTEFGFNVSKGPYAMQELCFDNVFALSEQDEFYRTPDHTTLVKANDTYLMKRWKPWRDVTVNIVIIPLEEWHLRIHYIRSDRPLSYMDCGFSSACDSVEMVVSKIDDETVSVEYENLKTKVILMSGGQPVVSEVLVNSNLLHNRVVVPYVKGDLNEKETVVYNLFYGGKNDKDIVIPKVSVDQYNITIDYNGKAKTFNVESHIND